MPGGHFQEYVDAALFGSSPDYGAETIIPMPIKFPQRHPYLLSGLADIHQPSSGTRRAKTFLTSFGGDGGDGGNGGSGDNDSGSNNNGGSSDSTDAKLEFTTSSGEQMKLSSKSKSACNSDCKAHFSNKKQEEAAEGDNSGSSGGFMSALKSGAAAATDTTDQDIQECEYFCEEQFSLACFPSDATTIVHQRGRVPLSELQVGDLVMVVVPTGADSWTFRFEPVLAWLHRVPERTSEMLEIRHRTGQIQMTPDHMIFARQRQDSGEGKAHLGPSEPTLARQLKPGDHVYAPWIDGEVVQSEVLSISRVKKHGLYAPLVDGGYLLVNGTVVSCYAIPEPVADTKVFRTVAHYTSGSTIHSFAHAAFQPLRSMCRASQALNLGDRDEKSILPAKADKQTPADLGTGGVHSYAWAVYVAVMALSP